MAPLGRDLTRICLTGAECTGKSTLASRLAARFGGVVVPEFARNYAERVARELTYDDVGAIAEGQMALERDLALPSAVVAPPTPAAIHFAASALGQRDAAEVGGATTVARMILILDTDLVSTVVYSRHHYGDCPAWVVKQAKSRLADLYLLLEADVPWIADGVRDSGARREQLHAEFAATLRELSARVITISGGWDAREQMAIAAVETLLV